jgi:hypothetical protein
MGGFRAWHNKSLGLSPNFDQMKNNFLSATQWMSRFMTAWVRVRDRA